MIAGKEKLVAIKKDDVTARVSRRGNHEQIVVELDRLFTANHPLNTETTRAVVSMHQSFAIESIAKQLVRRNVVFVCQQHLAHAAHLFDLLHELARKSWRVDQHIAAFTFGTNDQITPGAEAVFRRETAEVNIVFEQHRERIDAEMRVVTFNRADGSGRTRDERHHRELRLIVCFRLMIDAALLAVIAKDHGRELTTRITIDARGINEEVARDILR